ncbi:MAG: hypothetical protein ACOC35_09675 [Promethearchaeia archaeon]
MQDQEFFGASANANSDTEVFLPLNKMIENIPHNFTRAALQTIYPKKTIRRILAKPYLGKWYYYMDVDSPSYDSQLTLLYGTVDLCFSDEKFCVLCEKLLRNKNQNAEYLDKLPVSLCSKCRRKVFYDYWDCFKVAFLDKFWQYFPDNQPKNDQPKNDQPKGLNQKQNSKKDPARKESKVNPLKNKGKTICADFFKPRCKYPASSEKINPCLKSYGIGISILNSRTLKVISAPIKKLKYKMIWEGGLYGVILGKAFEIINLRDMVSISDQFFKILSQVIKQKPLSEIKVIPSASFNTSFNNGDLELENHLFIKFLINSYLTYYNFKDIMKFRDNLLVEPLSVFKMVIENLMERLSNQENILEVLDVIPLYKKTPGISLGLRDYINSKIKDKIFQKKNIKNKDFLPGFCALAESSPKRLLEIIYHVFSELKPLKISELKKSVHLYKIFGTFGSNLLCKTNIGNEPCLINISELIGRRLI